MNTPLWFYVMNDTSATPRSERYGDLLGDHFPAVLRHSGGTEPSLFVTVLASVLPCSFYIKGGTSWCLIIFLGHAFRAVPSPFPMMSHITWVSLESSVASVGRCVPETMRVFHRRAREIAFTLQNAEFPKSPIFLSPIFLSRNAQSGKNGKNLRKEGKICLQRAPRAVDSPPTLRQFLF
jgi:hypothetical protein